MQSFIISSPVSPLARCFVVALLFLISTIPTQAEESSNQAMRARIEGVYSLEEWHKDGQVFHPPQVEGRSILLNGTIMVMLHNRNQESAPVTVAAYGGYVLDGTTFSYHHDNWSVFTEAASGIAASHKLLFEGVRSFAGSFESAAVRLRALDGPSDFSFTDDKLIYSEDLCA